MIRKVMPPTTMRMRTTTVTKHWRQRWVWWGCFRPGCFGLCKLSQNCWWVMLFMVQNPALLLIKRQAADAIATAINQPDFIHLIRLFLHEPLHTNSASNLSSSSFIFNLPTFKSKAKIFIYIIYNSAAATFFAPSDISGVRGMRHEHIRAVPSWRRGPARYDCIFVNTDPSGIGMHGLDIACVQLFFSFMYDGIKYPCALIRWLSCIGDEPDKDSGMWMVHLTPTLTVYPLWQ